MVFGNHEFDLGSSEDGHQSLEEFVQAANFPLLGTNVDFSNDPYMSGIVNDGFIESAESGMVYDGIIKEVDGEKVGIFGLTTEDTANISSPVNVEFLSYIEEAQRAVDQFSELGIDKIIAVNHIGYDSNPPDMGNDLQLSKYVDGIDVIVGGHSHSKLEEPVVVEKDENGADKDPTVIVQAYQYAQLLGRLDVQFNENGVVTESAGQLIDVTEKEPNEDASKILAPPYKKEVDKIIDQETGAVAAKPLLNPRLSDSEVSVRANETELGNLITDAMLAKAKEKDPSVVIAMQNGGGGIRAAIDKGPITVGEVMAVLPPFGNDPVVAQLTGQEIKQILEHSVSQAPKESGGFLQIAGMRFTYDSGGENEGSRVISMEIARNGEYQKIAEDQIYSVTTNNFTGKGGDGFEVFAKAYEEGRVKDIGEIDWEQLRDYMAEDLNGQVDPVIEGRIIDLQGEEPEQPELPKEPEEDPNKEEPNNEQDGDSSDEQKEEAPEKDGNDGNDNQSTNNPSNEKESEKLENDQSEKEQKIEDHHQNQNEGNSLPNTATNLFTFLLIGGLLLFIGICVLLFKKFKIVN
ncbi:5'-nucleotidase C-terminal domain-containing protein [Gracilibacillus sp. JCM 18860]|uniref:5'-nucleotidase C-terminal domain-containing protein n=1 Tax=Gracilibacillus sp. JCM 18860 TaxID=1306159 RepID=UPI0006D16EBF